MWKEDGLKSKIENAVRDATSMMEAARIVGMPFTTFIRYAKKWNLYNTNESGKGVPQIPIKEFLKNNVVVKPQFLKNRLINEGLIEEKCEWCNIISWRGERIVLELDHINGNNKDNRRENIRLLCPNCHSQTSTFRGKRNTGKRKYTDEEFVVAVRESETITQLCYNLNIAAAGGNLKSVRDRMQKMGLSFPPKETPIERNERKRREKFINTCHCGVIIARKSTMCSSCHSFKQRRTQRPAYEILAQEISTMNYVTVGEKYGVSDNTIRKWMKSYERQLPS